MPKDGVRSWIGSDRNRMLSRVGRMMRQSCSGSWGGCLRLGRMRDPTPPLQKKDTQVNGERHCS